MVTDRSTYVCVPSLGIDVLVAEFARHVYDRHAHEVYVLGAIEPRLLGVCLDTGHCEYAGFDPVVVGKLADASRFQRGGPGYGQQATAAELRQKLSLAP